MVNWLKSNLVPGRSRVGREPRTEKAGYLHIWWNLSALAWERRLRAHLCSCPCILHHSHFRKTHSWRDGDIYIFIVSRKCTKLTLKAYLFIYAPSSSETLQQKNIPLGINKVYLPNVSKYIRGGFNKKNLPHHTKTPFVQLWKLQSASLTLSSGWEGCFLWRWDNCSPGFSQHSTAGTCACSCAGSPPGRHSDSTQSPGTKGLWSGNKK